MPSTPSALTIYETAVSTTAPTGPHWSGIAAQLLDEATTFTGGLRQKRIDRANDAMERSRPLGFARMEVVS
jgi:hypothetical protein